MKKVILLGAAAVLAFSCKKEDAKDTIKDQANNDYTSASDQAISDVIWQDIQKQSDEASQSEGVGVRSCGTVTLNPIGTFPTTLTIDFGTSGCVGNDGRFRVGKIVSVLTGHWRDSGTTVTITPDNYSVDGYHVSGTKTIENKGRINGNLTYDVAVTNGKIIAPNGDSATRDSDVTYEWIAGENTTFMSHGTAGILDDIYLIRGTYTGVNRNGLAYTANTTTDIRKELSCKWPVSGVLDINPQGLPTRTIDFGNGTCDDDATVTVNNITIAFDMQ